MSDVYFVALTYRVLLKQLLGEAINVGKVVDGFFVALLFSSIFVYAVFLQQTTDTSQQSRCLLQPRFLFYAIKCRKSIGV